MLLRLKTLHFLCGILLVSAGIAATQPLSAEEPKPAHGLAMHGDLKYGPDFKHFDYVDPNAPQRRQHPAWSHRLF